MISMIAPAVFAHLEHEKFTVCLDSIDGYSAKYAVITIPHQLEEFNVIGEVIETQAQRPVVGKLEFSLKAEAGKPIELTRNDCLGARTVKTPYRATRDIEAYGVMHYHSYLKSKGLVYVCNL